MRRIWFALSTVVVLTAGGCAGTVPIKNLSLPPVTAIEGTITRLEEGGFTLQDSSDSIYVRARLPEDQKLDVSPYENVKVYGNLQGGQERGFGGYAIRKQTGEQIIISDPTPHFGFIIQTSFQ
jgi:hypothetical protein